MNEQKQSKEAACRTLSSSRGAGSVYMADHRSLVCQRIILLGDTRYPNRWNQISDENLQAAADDAMAKVKENPTPEERAGYIAAWNRLSANEKKTYVVDADDFPEALNKSYKLAEECKMKYNTRTQNFDLFTRKILKENHDLEVRNGGRNPLLVPKNPGIFGYIPVEGGQRVARHLSTFLLSKYPRGVEFQASIGPREILVSSNTNGINKKVGGDIRDANTLLGMVTEECRSIIGSNGAEGVEGVKEDRVKRHTIKLYYDLQPFSGYGFRVPVADRNMAAGTHAEIRIHQDGEFASSTYSFPRGTKLPCLGCFLYFLKKEVTGAGLRCGPGWLTNAGFSQQLAGLIGQKPGAGKDSTNGFAAAGEVLAATYEEMSENAEIGGVRDRNGGVTYDHDADSDDEFELPTFLAVPDIEGQTGKDGDGDETKEGEDETKEGEDETKEDEDGDEAERGEDGDGTGGGECHDEAGEDEDGDEAECPFNSDNYFARRDALEEEEEGSEDFGPLVASNGEVVARLFGRDNYFIRSSADVKQVLCLLYMDGIVGYLNNCMPLGEGVSNEFARYLTEVFPPFAVEVYRNQLEGEQLLLLTEALRAIEPGVEPHSPEDIPRSTQDILLWEGSNLPSEAEVIYAVTSAGRSIFNWLFDEGFFKECSVFVKRTLCDNFGEGIYEFLLRSCPKELLPEYLVENFPDRFIKDFIKGLYTLDYSLAEEVKELREAEKVGPRQIEQGMSRRLPESIGARYKYRESVALPPHADLFDYDLARLIAVGGDSPF